MSTINTETEPLYSTIGGDPDLGAIVTMFVDEMPARVTALSAFLADGNWEDLLDATARLPSPPNLVVFSRLADASLWAKVLNLGGFDVLMTPFEPEEVLRVTFAAWSRWECDFVASTAKEAEVADRTTISAGKRCTPLSWTAGSLT